MRLMVASIANVTPNIEPNATSSETTSDSTACADRTISASSANAIGSKLFSTLTFSDVLKF